MKWLINKQRSGLKYVISMSPQATHNMAASAACWADRKHNENRLIIYGEMGLYLQKHHVLRRR